MADCTYRFIDKNGKPRVIAGQAAFKAYLASGGLQHLMPNVAFSPKQTESREFKRWFGDSKVVDADGKPLVVYHGSTAKGVTVFDTTRVTTRSAKGDVAGTYFTSNPMVASGYTRPAGATIKTPRGEVVQAYLRIENPLNTTAAIKRYQKKGMSFGDAKRKALEALTPENDGVIFDGDRVNPPEYVVFNPTQIKSATGNNGQFDPTNPDIRYSPRQDLKPEDVLMPGTVTKAREAITKYKKAEPPDPLSAADRAHGEALLKPLFAAAERNKPAFDATLDRIAQSVDGYAKKPGIKKLFRAVTKLATENGYDPATMKDLLRGTIVVETPQDAQRVLDEIGGIYKLDRVKNRLAIDLVDNKGKTLQGKPLSTGYQDVLTNVVLDDGTIAEIQISTPGMIAAKNLGHEVYAFEREMPVSPVKAKMVDLQKQIYAEGANFDRAAQASNTRLNSALSTGSAFSRTSEGLRGEGAGSQAVAERQSGETVTGTSFQSKNMVPGARESKSNFIGTSAPIIPETGAFNRPPIAFSKKSKPEFFSQLSRVIGEVPNRLATMPAQQWKAWLDSNSAKLGVKKDEIEWSGVMDYLDLQGKNKVTKDDLVAYLDANGVEVSETILGATGLDAVGEMYVEDANLEGDEFAVFDGEDRIIGGTYSTREEAEDALKAYLEDSPSKYGQYTLPGGENYREILLTLPMTDESEVAGLSPATAAPVLFNGRSISELTDEERNEVYKAVNQKNQDYVSRHWSEKNILAHIRVNDRTDADGKRVLFVEEVQSDWGQEGKKKGFASEADWEVRDRGNGTFGVYQKSTGQRVEFRDGTVAFTTREAAEAAIKEKDPNNAYGAKSGVPTAPFVTKTEGWLNLALKRIAMMAVEGGYDKVAFVNGDQSADRYDLSKQVDRLEYFPGSKNLVAMRGNQMVFSELNVAPERLESIIGKEAAAKLLAQPVQKTKRIGETGMQLLEGEDLKVGGEGMKAFYDQIVPQALNKLLPKLGGEKLGVVDLSEKLDPRAALARSLVSDVRTEAGKSSKNRPTQQPGFDVTDKMRETVGQGVPLFSKRQPMGKETEGWIFSRDATGRFRFGAGAKAYRYAADVANDVLDVVGLKPVSPELARAMRKMRVEIDKAQNLTVEVAKNMKDLPQQEREMVSDVIEAELKRGANPPKRVLEIAATMQSIMSEQSAELVRLDMLSPEAAGRWDGKYLPRFYEQKLGDETKAWMKAVKGLLGRKKTMQGIGGSSLKARGMFETVPVADLADWEANGWEVRDDAFDPAVDDQITVWRDYTRQERDDMGEIRDSMFRFVMGYNKSQRDIALGRLYENLAANYASRFEKEGYVQVPATNVEDTFAKRYGKLAGKWVPKEVLDQLVAFDTSMQNDLLKMYLKGLSMWKEGKTVLNPVAHANNVMSNITMAHFAGVSYWDGHKYVGAIKDLVKGDPMVDEAKEAGLFGGTFDRAELMNAMPEELRVLAQMSESKAKQSVDMIWNALSLWLRKPLGKAYAAEDSFFRYIIYRDARDQGLGPDDAADYALQYMFSYDNMPKGARLIRDMPIGLPFFAYTYNVVPALAKTALEQPWRYAAPAVALYAINAAMYAMAASLGGGDDEDWWTVIQRYLTDPEFRDRAKKMEEQERKNLPPWQKGESLMLGTEKTIRLGMDDMTNLPVFLDVSRIFPGGDIFDAHNNAGGMPIIAPLMPNSPVLTTTVAILYNKDTFRGRDVTDKTDTSAEAAAKRAAFMWRQMTPAIAIGNTHFERAMNVIANVTGEVVKTPLANYTGVGKDGVPIMPSYAAMQTVGIKARPIDLAASEKFEKAEKKRMITEIDIKMRSLRKQRNKGSISDETAEIELEKLREKKRNLNQGLTVEGEEKD